MKKRAGLGKTVKVAVILVIVILVSMGLEIQANAKSVTKTPIQHVVIIIQENHSFFNYWGDYPGVIGGVADATCQQYKNGTTLCPYETNVPESDETLDHGGRAADIAYNNGSMNQFLIGNPVNQVMSYYNATVLGYYWGLAEHYTLNDMFFSSYRSYSLPNHWAAIAGVSPNIAITTMANGVVNNATLSDLLEQASMITTMLEAVENQKPITAKYYDEPVKYANLSQAIALEGKIIPGGYWNPNLEKADAYTTLRNDFEERTSIFTDISKGKLPAISWVIPNQNISEHPQDDVQLGEQWVQSVVDAVMNSKYWSSTAIFIMTDDWGGYYDPIVPSTLPNISPGNNTAGEQGLGFRVSALLVSPYANSGIVNTVFSFESVLHFIDYNWGLPLLNQRVADSNNMLTDFNFNQSPLPAWTGTPLTPAQMQNVMGNASLDTPDVD